MCLRLPPTPWCSCHTSSTRSQDVRDPADLALGVDAASASGKRTSTPDMRKSISDASRCRTRAWRSTDGGASGDVAGICDDEPMCMQTTVPVLGARGEERVPVAGVDRRQPEVVRDLAEATACTPRAALRRTSSTASSTSHSGMSAERDQPPARVAAPLLDHPVVVRLDAGEPELLVVALGERLAAEAREASGSTSTPRPS